MKLMWRYILLKLDLYFYFFYLKNKSIKTNVKELFIQGSASTILKNIGLIAQFTNAMLYYYISSLICFLL